MGRRSMRLRGRWRCGFRRGEVVRILWFGARDELLREQVLCLGMGERKNVGSVVWTERNKLL